MRFIKCDVCGEDYSRDDPVIEMVIPAYFLNEKEDDHPGFGLTVDVCSWQCVGQMVEGAEKRESDEPDQPEQETKEPAFIAVPKLPTIDVDMDEKTLAKFTEEATGVKRR